MWPLRAPHRLFLHRLFDDSLVSLRTLRYFEAIFFAGLAFHFSPYLLRYERFLGESGNGLLNVRELTPEWTPSWLLVVFAYLACALGMLGICVRGAALLALVSLQSLLHRNSAPVLTLAISHAWSVLFLLVLGGGTSKLGIAQVRLAGGRRLGAAWTRALILYSTLLGVFFSALEKLESRWLTEHPMQKLLAFPDHHLVRSWAITVLGPHRDAIAPIIECCTLLFELTVPLLLTVTTAPRRLVWIWLGFFGTLFLVLEVPVLFLTTYGSAVVLASDSKAATTG